LKRIRIRTVWLLLVFAGMAATATAGDNPQQAFARSWEGQTVVLKQILYTLVYNERGRLGTTHSARRDGLTVVSPTAGLYFQFDGRQGKDDVVAKQPQRIIDAVNAAYEKDALEVRSYRKVEPLMINRYAVGFELTVGRVRVDRDTVRLAFVQATPDGSDDPATALTIKWSAPFSKSFSERHAVEALIRQFVHIKGEQ